MNGLFTDSEVTEQAEGQPERPELREAAIRLQSPQPAVHEGRSDFRAAAETGVIQASVPSEGRETHDDQDAAHTLTELIPVVQPVSRRTTHAAPTVLIVEDTRPLAEIIRMALEPLKINVFHETHGAGALETYRQHQPDLVLLDIGLPDTTGWKVLDEIRRISVEASAPMPMVIVMTAYGDPTNRVMGKMQDVQNYLIKPFTVGEVQKAVQDAFEELTA